MPGWQIAKAQEVAVAAPGRSDPPVAASAMPEPITVLPLDRTVPDHVGVVPPAEVGLPEGLWQSSNIDDLVRKLEAIEPPRSAPMQEMLHDMLRVSAPPPKGSRKGQAFFLARLDALMALGRLDTARTLMERAGMHEPEIFRRWFDMTILTGDENTACGRMRALPEITPTYPARIFCLARSGDWPAAVVTLESARALGVIDSAETERLTRFLDDLAETAKLPPPAEPSMLDFVLYEAVGEPLRTPVLPLPFAHADLRQHIGWKARVEAAERLARSGAADATRLWTVYSERAPAASGDPWDRVAAVQRLDAALLAGDEDQVATALVPAWDRMRTAGLLNALAQRVAPELDGFTLPGEAQDIARRLSALAGIEAPPPADPALAALLNGDVPQSGGTDPVIDAISAGLSNQPPDEARAMIDTGRIGEALLLGAAQMQDGWAGNLDALSDGLATLNGTGRGDTALRAAIDLLLTDTAP
ncbi:hypothetical protein [Palleronia marisminoris]|uniref:hypothetical protein n=1 Tax=Palleronia marisminoris TaxID=315423 RepID=UPI0011140324|nr:hypothetical protein [Palleronia marisminoris]